MITLTAKINLTSKDSGTLSGVSSEISKNNISSDIGSILGSKSQGSNPFILGVSKLGDGSTLSDKVDYFIGSVPSNENPCVLTISGTDITSFTIEFDKVNNRHPNTINIDGTYYACDNAIFTVVVPSANSHTITIDNWNTPLYPLVIMGIYVDIEIQINNRNLISLESSLFDRGDIKLPSYGIISNTGNLEFNDLDGEIRDYAEQMLLQSGLQVKLNLKNTLIKGKEEQVALMETAQWDYDNNNRVVSVSLKDDLEEWQDIQVKGFSYDPRNPKAVLPNQTLADLYKWLQSPNNTPEKYNMLSFEQLDSNTKEILNGTYLPYPLLKDGTLWEQWTKVCQVCSLYIYKNGEGKTVCSYTYGS